MQVPRSITVFSFLALVVAACGGTPTGATQAPGDGGTATEAPGGGGSPTDVSVATQADGGGGGNSGGGSGSLHIEVSGPVQASGDYPFFSIGSRFGGPAGVALNFTGETTEGIASIGSVGDDVWVISLITEAISANSQECQLSNWNIGATSASGSFDCKNGFAINVADGAYLTGVNMKGNFTASQ